MKPPDNTHFKQEKNKLELQEEYESHMSTYLPL